MTLYDLSCACTLQGNIEIKVFNQAGEELESRCAREQVSFECVFTNTDDLEDCEVSYMYATKSADGTEWLVIELVQEADE